MVNNHFAASKTVEQHLDINVTDVNKITRLDVLKADIPCIASVTDDLATGANVAIEFHGSALFSIDMTMTGAEIFTDQARRRVEVVLPPIEMDIAIDRGKTNLRFFKNNFANAV